MRHFCWWLFSHQHRMNTRMLPVPLHRAWRDPRTRLCHDRKTRGGWLSRPPVPCPFWRGGFRYPIDRPYVRAGPYTRMKMSVRFVFAVASTMPEGMIENEMKNENLMKHFIGNFRPFFAQSTKRGAPHTPRLPIILHDFANFLYIATNFGIDFPNFSEFWECCIKIKQKKDTILT